MKEQLTRQEERWPMTASISILLHPIQNNRGLVLVNVSDRWGIPAGRLNPGEYLDTGIRRELAEETGIREDQMYFESAIPYRVICLPGEQRTQIGLVFKAFYVGPRLSRDGWQITHDEEAKFAKPFSIKELVNLLDRHLGVNSSENSPLYKPEFNFTLLLDWLVTSWKDAFGLRQSPPAYLGDFLKRVEPKVEYLQASQPMPQLTGDEAPIYIYNPPCLRIEQNPQAYRRAHYLY